MPTIKVDSEVWHQLQKHASELRRLLKLRGNKRTRPPGPLPQCEFWLPILDALKEMGGKGSRPEVLDRVEKRIGGILTPQDTQFVTVNELHWRRTASFARQTMKEDGLLKSGAPRGVWEITERGEAYLKGASSA